MARCLLNQLLRNWPGYIGHKSTRQITHASCVDNRSSGKVPQLRFGWFTTHCFSLSHKTPSLFVFFILIALFALPFAYPFSQILADQSVLPTVENGFESGQITELIVQWVDNSKHLEDNYQLRNSHPSDISIHSPALEILAAAGVESYSRLSLIHI